MGTFVVSCVKRDELSGAQACIRSLGGHCAETGRRWHMSAEEAIACILDGIHEFVAIVGGRNAHLIVVDHPAGYASLKTSLDREHENSLLLRPPCPALEMGVDSVRS